MIDFTIDPELAPFSAARRAWFCWVGQGRPDFEQVKDVLLVVGELVELKAGVGVGHPEALEGAEDAAAGWSGGATFEEHPEHRTQPPVPHVSPELPSPSDRAIPLSVQPDGEDHGGVLVGIATVAFLSRLGRDAFAWWGRPRAVHVSGRQTLAVCRCPGRALLPVWPRSHRLGDDCPLDDRCRDRGSHVV
jgi:hypothetical protein